VTSPVKFKSVCGAAGVSEDGKLYVWGGAAFEAAAYRKSSVATRIVDRSMRYSVTDTLLWSDGLEPLSSLLQVGDDADWKFVASPPAASVPTVIGSQATVSQSAIIAVKTDGSMWTLGDWQSGVDCDWSSGGTFSGSIASPSPAAWRAKLNSPISSLRTDFSLDQPRFLPVWFTETPRSSVSIQKLRLRLRRSGYVDNYDISVATGEPGSGATVRSEYRAKIDDGCILSATISSGGSGYTPSSEPTVTVTGHEGTGSGAVIKARVGATGAVESVVILDPGEGYRHPVTATVTGNATISIAEPKRVRVISEGTGYTSVPTVNVAPAAGDQSADAQPNAAYIEVSEMSRCGVGGLEVTSGGSGYTFATAVETRTGATATAVVSPAGAIIDWTLNSPGSPVYSPLDDEPLDVEVTGDGEGASARAIPAGSRVLEVKVISNPEVWTLPPTLSFAGGGGSEAAAVVDGIIGRLSLSVDEGGSGYTKSATRFAMATGAYTTERSQYFPCAVVAASGAVGGRRFDGGVIVGEAILAPSEIVSVDEDAADYINPHRNPYRTPTESTELIIEPAEMLKRHRLAMSGLTAASGGVVHPFEETIFLGPYSPQFEDSESGRQQFVDYVSECIRAYLLGPNHERHPLEVTVDSRYVAKVSLAASLSMPQPPALCIEVLARPHKYWPLAAQNVGFAGAGSGVGCYVPEIFGAEEADGSQSWWADGRRDNDLLNTSVPFFVGGEVAVTGVGESKRVYQSVDGVLREHSVSHRSAPSPLPDGTPTPTISGAQQYRGPVRENVLADPSPSWSKPSDAQRVHFIYPTGGDFSARAIAEVVYDETLRHPVVGPVTVAENGKYDEEPEALVYFGGDPAPHNSGLTACTSAGFGLNGDAFAYAGGQLLWWGNSAAIADNASLPARFQDDPTDMTDAAAVYRRRLRDIARARPGVTAKPTPTGGHLRFAVSGDLAFDAFGGVAFMRAPRPSYGNKVASLSHVFASQETRGVYALKAGTQDSDAALLRYRPRALRLMDHGVGYAGSVTVDYRGPGLSPHTLSLTASVVGHGIVHVGENGLLRDSSGRWRVPEAGAYSEATRSVTGWWSPAAPPEWNPTTIDERTVTVVDVERSDCGISASTRIAQRYTAVDGDRVEQRNFIAVVRTPGSGGSTGILSVSGPRLSLSARGEPVPGGVRNEFSVSRTLSNGSIEAPMSSRGGIRTPVYISLVSDTPPTASVTNGQGVVVEVFESPELRFTPFSLWCLDSLSETVEPSPAIVEQRGLLSRPYFAGVAVAPDGTLRSVRDRLSFTPEAFASFQAVTRVTAVAPENIPLPYYDEGDATHVCRDVGGRLWAVRSEDLGWNLVGTGPFLRGLAISEPSTPRVVAPIAIAATDTGEGYDYPPSVTTSKPSGVASGAVTIDGKVVGIAVVDGGSGYETPPTVVGAAAQTTIAGGVWRIDVTAGGTGYRHPPRVRFSSPGLPAEAISRIDDNGRVTSVEVTSGGMYHQQPPLVSFEAVFDVESIAVSSGGNGYSEAPSVTVVGGGGSGASATATISCSVSEIIMLSQGSGYITTPTVEITGGGGSGAAARAVLDSGSGRIVRIEVTSGGTGYTSRPTVRVISTGSGGGSDAVAEIEGFVSSIELTSRGDGYESPPRVIITGGGGLGAAGTASIAAVGSGAAATARINGSVVAVDVTNPGGNLQKPPAVSCDHVSQPVEGLARSNAIIKAVILGRPTSVSVTDQGSDYYPPFFSQQASPAGDGLRTPSSPVRRPIVFGKGSFFFSSPLSSDWSTNIVGPVGPLPKSKLPTYRGFAYRTAIHDWLNTFPLLGIAEVVGASAGSGGAIGEVLLPKVVTRLRVQTPGSGYVPHTLIPIVFRGGGTKDDRFRLLVDNDQTRLGGVMPPREGDIVAYAYSGSSGEIIGVVQRAVNAEFQAPMGLPAGVAAYTSPPQFEIDSTGVQGSGATLTAELDHPLECYYAPQVIFDGDHEVEADTALTLAGVAVEGDGQLPSVCLRGPEHEFWSRRMNKSSLNRSKLFLRNWISGFDSAASLPQDVRLDVVGSVVGFSPFVGRQEWPEEDQDFFDAPAGFFSTAPAMTIEDEDGTGASITAASLPASGAISVKWIGDAVLSRGGSEYALSARLRLRGGRPLAWDNPATATAQVRQGRVSAVTIQNGGKGYTRPPLVFIVGDGEGATAEIPQKAINPETGTISSIRILSRGSGYTSATVVIVDRETVAEESEAVAAMCEFIDSRYSVALENCTLRRAFIPPERRRRRTTVSVRNVLDAVELGPSDSVPADFPDEIKHELYAAGYRLHGAFLSDGYVEYVRLEHHFGQASPASPTVTITPNSDVAPTRPATAVAKVPLIDNVFSSTAANVTAGGPEDFPWTQFD